MKGWKTGKVIKPSRGTFTAPTEDISVSVKSTYIAAALSTRFNHVGVIAIKKHPTETQREESTCQHQLLLFNSSRNRIMHLNSTPPEPSVWYTRQFSACPEAFIVLLSFVRIITEQLLSCFMCPMYVLGRVEGKVRQNAIQSSQRFPHTALLKGHLRMSGTIPKSLDGLSND